MWAVAILAFFLGASIGFLIGVFFVSAVRGPVQPRRDPWYELEDLGEY